IAVSADLCRQDTSPAAAYTGEPAEADIDIALACYARGGDTYHISLDRTATKSADIHVAVADLDDIHADLLRGDIHPAVDRNIHIAGIRGLGQDEHAVAAGRGTGEPLDVVIDVHDHIAGSAALDCSDADAVG